MSSDNPQDIQQDFEAAKNRLRITGVGGILESNDKHGVIEPKEEGEEINNSKKKMTFKNGVVMLGNSKVKTIQQNSSIKVFLLKEDTTKK